MIKQLLTIGLIASFSISNAQIELREHNGSTTIVNGTNMTVNAVLLNDMNQDVPVEIDVTSLYSTTKTLRVKKIEKTSTAPLSENAICWGLCTIGVVWGTLPVQTSDPSPINASATVLFSAHLYPKLQSGTSVFRYVFYDFANPTDSTWVDVTFNITNPNSVSINEEEKETSLSLFPNPATTELNVKLNSNEKNKRIEIIDLLGKQVYSRNITNESATFKVNTIDFKPGVYFVSVKADNKSVKTEKIIITK